MVIISGVPIFRICTVDLAQFQLKFAISGKDGIFYLTMNGEL